MSAKASPKALAGLVALVMAAGGLSQWWYGHTEGTLGAEMAQRASTGDIELVSSVTCEYCAMARQWLDQYQVKHTECFIERDAACKARFEAARSPGTPVVRVRGQTQIGFDPRRVIGALKGAAG